MEVIKNIEKKQEALREAEVAMLTLNQHLGKEYFSKEIMGMISELKVDLYEIEDAQETMTTTFGPFRSCSWSRLNFMKKSSQKLLTFSLNCGIIIV